MRRFTSLARWQCHIVVIALVLTTSALVSLSHCGDHSSANADSYVTPDVWETIARARLNHLQSRFKQEDTFKDTGLKIGNPAWDEYVNELQGVYQQSFKPDAAALGDRDLNGTVQRIQERLTESLNDLSKHTEHPEYQRLSDYIPHTIHVTSKKPIFPPQFSTWDRLNSKDGWQIKHWDDDRIWEWMKKLFAHQDTTGDGGSGKTEGAQILKVYEQLPSGVLRGKRDVSRPSVQSAYISQVQPIYSGEVSAVHHISMTLN